jgi:hypothetical protein
MWTGLKENSEYSAQITPYHGYVMAEIISRDKDTGLYDYKLDLWLTVLDKSFGSMWRKTPTEKDWQDANKWAIKQLELIEKYGTVIVKKPQHLRNNKN